MQAYACRIKEENFSAIASEKPDFDIQETLSWLEEHEDGYFIRHEGSPWDCVYMPMLVFSQIYLFESYNRTELFHQIVMD